MLIKVQQMFYCRKWRHPIKFQFHLLHLYQSLHWQRKTKLK